MNQSEPFFLPLFFTLCIHMSFFVLLSYWGTSEFPKRDTLGPSISVALKNLPPSPPKPIPKPAPSRPAPPKEVKEVKEVKEIKEVEEKKEEKKAPEAEIPVQTDEKKLDKLIENLRETQPKKEAPAPKQEEIKEELLVREQTTSNPNREETSLQQQELRNEALAYYERNKELVERNFNPGTAAQRSQFQGLVTRIKIFLDEKGKLVDVQILVSSGNPLFDVEAERAVRRVDGFIIPSDRRLQESYFREIIMEFSLSRGR